MLLVGSVDAYARDDSPGLRILALDSEVFGNSRKLRVWLPQDYAAPENRKKRYPVLYLNDGQNLFDPETSLFGGGEWRVDETVSLLIAEGRIPPLIVVGIDNAGREGRAYEYLVYPDIYLDPPVPDPAGHDYPAFFREVIAKVEREFRTISGPSGRTLGGSSYGALVALHLAMEQPGLVSQLLLESPSLYVDDAHALRDVESSPPDISRAYIGIGSNELGLEDCAVNDSNREAVNDAEQLASSLRSAAIEVNLVVEQCATHTEAAWARRLPAALEFLYGD